MSKIKSNLSKVTYYMLLVVCVIIVLNALTSRLEIAYEIIGFRSYIVLSGSMEPELYPGDLVITAHKNRSNIGKGDVITFVRDSQVITHRVVKIKGDGYVTKGDNNNVIDAHIVKRNNVVGKVVMNVPKIGYLVSLLSNIWMIAIEMMLLGLFIIYYYKD